MKQASKPHTHPEKAQSVTESPRVQSVIKAYRENGARTDPDGMYTGIPREAQMHIDPAVKDGTTYRPLEGAKRRAATPVQDADDL